jgi:hypothetical protein
MEHLNKFITYMKNLLKKIGNFLRNLIEDVVDVVEAKAPKAVQVVQKVKEAIEEHGGNIEWVLEKTATEQDDEAFVIIKEKLPIVAKELATIEGLVGNEASTEEALAAYMEYIASKTKAARAKEFVILAAMILQAIITKKLPLEILIIATQKAYHLVFGKAIA